jgi:hypothetical protein
LKKKIKKLKSKQTSNQKAIITGNIRLYCVYVYMIFVL